MSTNPPFFRSGHHSSYIRAWKDAAKRCHHQYIAENRSFLVMVTRMEHEKSDEAARHNGMASIVVVYKKRYRDVEMSRQVSLGTN